MNTKNSNLISIIVPCFNSGKTLKKWTEKLNIPYFATLHYKRSSCVEPDFYGRKMIKEDKWIVYPWENKDSKTIQNYLEN